MNPELSRRAKRGVIVLACVVAALVLLPVLARLLGLAVGISFLAIQIVGYVILFVGLPFFVWMMGEAGYRVFLRPLVRARRIRKMRNRRLLLEAAARKSGTPQ
jgi:hypothetical protein